MAFRAPPAPRSSRNRDRKGFSFGQFSSAPSQTNRLTTPGQSSGALGAVSNGSTHATPTLSFARKGQKSGRKSFNFKLDTSTSECAAPPTKAPVQDKPAQRSSPAKFRISLTTEEPNDQATAAAPNFPFIQRLASSPARVHSPTHKTKLAGTGDLALGVNPAKVTRRTSAAKKGMLGLQIPTQMEIHQALDASSPDVSSPDAPMHDRLRGPARYIQRRHSADERSLLEIQADISRGTPHTGGTMAQRRRRRRRKKQKEQKKSSRASHQQKRSPAHGGDVSLNSTFPQAQQRSKGARKSKRKAGGLSKLTPSESTPVLFSSGAHAAAHYRQTASSFRAKFAQKQTEKTTVLRECAWRACQRKELRLGHFQVCSACLVTAYCSRECQQEHWGKGHKDICIEMRGRAQERLQKRRARERAALDDSDTETASNGSFPVTDIAEESDSSVADADVSEDEAMDHTPASTTCSSGSSSSSSGASAYRPPQLKKSTPSLLDLMRDLLDEEMEDEDDVEDDTGGALTVRLPYAEDTAVTALPLPPRAIRLVLFDMDNTLLNFHTQGMYRGSISDLASHVVRPFVELLPRLIQQGFHVGVVTFSDAQMSKKKQGPDAGLSGEPLVRALLRATFTAHFKKQMEQKDQTSGPANDDAVRQRVEQLLAKVHVAAAYPDLANLQPQFFANPMPKSKKWHIDKVRSRLRLMSGVRVAYKEVMLLDDSSVNVAAARKDGVHSFLVEKEHGLRSQLWVRAINSLFGYPSAS